MEAKRVKLAIKLNAVTVSDPCAVCGRPTDPQEGPELFLADDDLLVCHTCGALLAPELVDCLRAYWDAWERARRLTAPCCDDGQAGELVVIPCAGGDVPF